jgi:lipid-A-disaccharide synthase
MAEKKHILIVCGEPSGDLQAASLAKEILSLNPRITISGVGGTLLANAGAQLFCDISEFSVMGFFDVLRKLPRFFSLRKLVLAKIRQEKPDAVILVDFSGFNLRLAKAINRKTRVIYYISPQVWASRPGRIKTIKRYVDKVIVVFKFERDFYRRHGLEVDFVGHPLLDIVGPSMERKRFFEYIDMAPEKTTLALLPGSRSSEVERILPIMLQAAILIAQEIPTVQFIVAQSPHLDGERFQAMIKGLPIQIKIVEGKTYDCLNAADFCLVCSGTATLETAIMRKPFSIVYAMNPLNYLLYRPLVKVPYIGMVNLVAGEKIVAEFIQSGASPKAIAQETVGILKDPARLNLIESNLSRIAGLLGEKGASRRAARIVIDFLS